jgi:hypothetical protein
MSYASGRSVVHAAALFVGSILLVSCASSRDDRTDACGGCVAGLSECCTASDGVARCTPAAMLVGGMCPTGAPSDGGPGFDGGPRVDSGPPGMCSPTCSSAQRCCGTTCVNRSVTPGTDGRSDSSFMNCNACGIGCDSMRASACSQRTGMSGTLECLCGNFPQCTGSDVCVMTTAGVFQCVSLSTDPNNCGEIGNVCNMGEICSGGSCVCGSTGGPCAAGRACCSGACIDVTTDSMNCGACGNVCGAQGTTCEDGACRCGTGSGCRAPVGTDLGELCCADTCVPQDAMNCGGCGSTCTDDAMCIYGSTFGGTMEVCCGMEFFPGFPSFCDPESSDGGGFPGADGGVPFP